MDLLSVSQPPWMCYLLSNCVYYIHKLLLGSQNLGGFNTILFPQSRKVPNLLLGGATKMYKGLPLTK